MRRNGSALSRLIVVAFLFAIVVQAASVRGEEPLPVPVRDISQALNPFWRATTQVESLFFIQHDAKMRPQARLWFVPESVERVTSADGKTVYEAERDYTVDKATGSLSLPEGSRIPFKTLQQLYPLLTSNEPKIGRKRDDPTRGIFFGEGALYHSLQIEVHYTTDPRQFRFNIPKFAGENLPRTRKKLEAKEPIKILLSGDSISEGYNASRFTKAAPGSPAYGELVAASLELYFGSKVTFENFAHAGWSAGQGMKQAADEKLGAKQPDLVLIAFGMNDVGGRNAKAYQANIKGIIDTIRRDSPETEFILVASMLGNAEWGMPMDEFPKYRDALAELCGPGIALADLTSIWGELLEKKSFYDLTGNGVNHPNDCGHRIYAQVILALLIEETRFPDSLLRGLRTLYLGDSITHAGQYVAYVEAFERTKVPKVNMTIINGGLPSETVTGLSEEGHAGGRFPRPDLFERLDRVLEVVQPRYVYACYGMNCGIYLPFDEGRFRRYQEGIVRLKAKVELAGAELVLITPPCYDDERGTLPFTYNEVLGRYAQWLLEMRNEGWKVIDLHGPMTAELVKRREQDPQFTFQPDAVHPNAEGHWFIASVLIGKGTDAKSPQEMLAQFGWPPEALDLVLQRVNLLRDAYVGTAGHKRPGVAPGLPINRAEATAAVLLRKLRELTEKKKPE